MTKSIKFTASGSCSAMGNFASGDIARNLPDALADHLVKDAACAQYLDPAPVSQPAAAVVTPVAKAKRPPKANPAA